MDTREHVIALLEIAGIVPFEDEVDELVKGFPETRARVERMWALDLVDVPPATVFRAGEATGAEEAVRV